MKKTLLFVLVRALEPYQRRRAN